MVRPIKSQWEFGELFPAEQTRKVYSVSELTARVRRLLEKEFGQIWVTGEITNLKFQPSGHAYFTLKDVGAQVSCVLFRGETKVDRSLLQDGRKVLVAGEITVYEPRGQYQLRVTALELQGLGALQAAFERLKQKLKTEGLFDQARKRALPRFPQRVGLVTSPSGAALRDVVHVVERRYPGLQLVLAPCRVQGQGAAAEIAHAIALLNAYHAQASTGAGLDLILVTRGGGSLEDLWAFNEEEVARAIFTSGLPVVSAVGHEIDFTISDFVADLRAATPSAAAEIITEGAFSSMQFVSDALERLNWLARQSVERKSDSLLQHQRALVRLHPRRKLNDHLQRLDDLVATLGRCGRRHWSLHRNRRQVLAARLGRFRPSLRLRQTREVFEQARERLREQMHHHLREAGQGLAGLVGRLRLLGPEQVLARGYSITTDAATGEIQREASKVKSGQRLKSRLAVGEVTSRVEPSEAGQKQLP
jgi:exodeoxyribonuclease VII large subunit